ISPWSKNGDVYQYLKKNPNADRRTLIHDVAEGLLYRHTRNPPIVHADIKGYNVLVSDSSRAMLCGFGTASPWRKTQLALQRQMWDKERHVGSHPRCFEESPLLRKRTCTRLGF
ncbi:hypothetical protein M407DRAFT_233380, partial [Tulasnella calospora MUT 4182]